MHAQRSSRFLNGLILFALIFTPSLPAVSTQASLPEVTWSMDAAPDRLLVRVCDGYKMTDAGLESMGVTSARPLFAGQGLPAELGQIVLLELARGSDVTAMAEALGRDPRFEWVEPDYLAYPAQAEEV